MELTNHIANALIRMVGSMAKEWPSIVSIEPGLEEKLRQAAMSAPTNSEEFLRFLLLSCQPFPENYLQPLCPRICESEFHHCSNFDWNFAKQRKNWSRPEGLNRPPNAASYKTG